MQKQIHAQNITFNTYLIHFTFFFLNFILSTNICTEVINLQLFHENYILHIHVPVLFRSYSQSIFFNFEATFKKEINRLILYSCK